MAVPLSSPTRYARFYKVLESLISSDFYARIGSGSEYKEKTDAVPSVPHKIEDSRHQITKSIFYTKINIKEGKSGTLIGSRSNGFTQIGDL
jgi:hypothetical protein